MHASGRILSLLMAVASVNASDAVQAQQDRTLLYEADSLIVRWHLQLGLNAVSERNLFWNYAATIAPESGFDPNANWLESYIKPGLSFQQRTGSGSTFYGKLSTVGSYTSGIDAFDAGNTGRITLEEAYLGYRIEASEIPGVDISLGARDLQLGTGMLIANGGSSGFERGALKFGPRKAWKRAGIARVFGNGITGTSFYLEPNELPSNDGNNKLAGADVRYDASAGGYMGLTYINVFESETPYVKAARGGIGAPTIIPDGRKGTNALNFYARTNPFVGAFENWFMRGDFAYEWNRNVDLHAWAGRIQVGYTFNDIPWSPVLTYTYQSFSGDNPNTPQLERFDPLYYEGSPGAWATGSKSSLVFINSNTQAHEIALRVQPNPQDTVTIRYAHILANELRSPIQFGQATRVETIGRIANLVTGVTNAHLSDDIFVEFNRVINKNTFFTAGVSVSFPGEGIKRVVNGNAPNWIGGFANVVINF